MSDIKYIDGLIVKAPHERSPEYVKAKLSIKRQELIGWLESQSGEWINADIKVSQNGKWYCQIDDWKPDGGTARTSGQRQSRPAKATDGFDDDIDSITF